MGRGRGKPSHLDLAGKVDPFQDPGCPLPLGPPSEALLDSSVPASSSSRPQFQISQAWVQVMGPSSPHTTRH